MKTSILNAIHRAVAAFRVRSLEIQLHGQNEALQSVRCPDTRCAITLARIQTRRELAQARAEYVALLPAGERRTWSAA